MSVQEAALVFKRWAVENHVLRRGREDRLPLVQNPIQFDEERNKAASGVLRSKPISFLGYNEKTETIIVYVRARISRADEKKLPQEVQGYKVIYKKGVPAAWTGKVNSPTTDPYFMTRAVPTLAAALFSFAIA